MLSTSYCFDDVLLVPQFSDISSRSEISTSSSLSTEIKFGLPIVSSPMDTVTEHEMALAMEASGGFGIIHRYNTIENQVAIVREFKSQGGVFIGAAIGVSGDYIERSRALVRSGVGALCIDVAHGHHSLTRYALQTLRRTLGHDVHIMAGNVATLGAFNDLADWGANSIRVGIGGGSICSTRVQTGHGVPTLQSVMDCSMSDRDAVLIADGGIRNSGDIVKALAAGADFVMLGSLLSGTIESPGDIIMEAGKSWKEYRGMASIEAQIDWRGHTASVEGVSTKVPLKGRAGDILQDLSLGIRSGLSYTGAKSIPELQSKSRFIAQTSAGSVESSTHILKQ